MSITIDTPYGAAVELADVAGLGMADDQRQSLAALLATTSTGTWAAPDVEARSDAETDRYMSWTLSAGFRWANCCRAWPRRATRS